ncbi:hypothetical protein PENSPDRAFT_689270 [Peniophora sp. CONT]|nr:hypothetical protein PENSPDRAFT_689270 [Peniophora sp. CONT]
MFLYETLRPIRELEGAEFLKAYLDILLEHFLLWTRGGVHHRDLTLDNLMYRTEKNEVIGVLIDFDLATRSACQSIDAGCTLQYTAFEILDVKATGTPYTHLYRHDLESFYWILIWVCNCVENGREIDLNGSIFRPWKTGDYDLCYEKKLRYERGAGKHASLVLPTQNALWHIAVSWNKHIKRTLRPVTEDEPAPWTIATDAAESFTDFCRLLESKEVMYGLRAYRQSGDELLECIEGFLAVVQSYLGEEIGDMYT